MKTTSWKHRLAQTFGGFSKGVETEWKEYQGISRSSLQNEPNWTQTQNHPQLTISYPSSQVLLASRTSAEKVRRTDTPSMFRKSCHHDRAVFGSYIARLGLHSTSPLCALPSEGV